MGESKGKIFRCDAGGCNGLAATATNYRKKAPPGWFLRTSSSGEPLMACSADCSAKIDEAEAPHWVQM